MRQICKPVRKEGEGRQTKKVLLRHFGERHIAVDHRKLGIEELKIIVPPLQLKLSVSNIAIGSKGL